MSPTTPVVVSQTLRRRRGLTEQAAVAAVGPTQNAIFTKSGLKSDCYSQGFLNPRHDPCDGESTLGVRQRDSSL